MLAQTNPGREILMHIWNEPFQLKAKTQKFSQIYDEIS